MRTGRTVAAFVVAAVVGAALTACSVEHEQDSTGAGAAAVNGETGVELGSGEEVGEEAAPDLGTCVADLTEAPSPYPRGFPADWPWPEGTVVYDAEDRGDYGVVVSAATTTPFSDVLDFLNTDVQQAGYVVTTGETEERDAEADWEGEGFRGRWAIRTSSSCPGETTIQVLSTRE
ncbi:MAG TPA: hypothetical protein VNS55_03195 [Nocardioides sp.]|nr:hypothetical protein [Nocardioides sp.]